MSSSSSSSSIGFASDPSGIKNFREGLLTITDYLMSGYGSRWCPIQKRYIRQERFNSRYCSCLLASSSSSPGSTRKKHWQKMCIVRPCQTVFLWVPHHQRSTQGISGPKTSSLGTRSGIDNSKAESIVLDTG